MAKTLKAQKTGIKTRSAAAAEKRGAERKVVLVGTYKAKQLNWIKRHGVYNYPVKDGDEFASIGKV